MLLHRNRLTTALAVSALALAVSGCGSERPVSRTAAPKESSSSTAATKPAASAEPAEPVESQSASPSQSPSEPPSEPSGPLTLEDRLLTAEEMPGPNDEFSWKVAGTRTEEGAEPFGTCHKFAMTSIGATRVVARDYVHAGGASPDEVDAGHLVAEFADPRTARRALEVLKAWRGQCEEELGEYDTRKVHDFEPVEVPGGDGGWYLLIYGPPEGEMPDVGYFDAQGMVRVGKRISVLQMRGIGQDYNYPAGEEPLVFGVRAAAGKLG
ncbi:MAG TPA: hypothetical protein VGD51_09080 [Nocardioidaceae bacterium]